MSHHQTQPDPDIRYVETRPRKNPAFGLGITAGILAILLSMLFVIPAVSITGFALEDYKPSILPAIMYWPAISALFVFGIVQIALNRRRDWRLPAILMGAALLILTASTIGWLSDVHGDPGLHIVFMLPLLVASLLAYLSARKSSRQSHTAPV